VTANPHAALQKPERAGAGLKGKDSMDTETARGIAHQIHIGQQTRHGSLVTEHLERVAAAVPEPMRTVAYLHDALEHSDISLSELQRLGLSAFECEVVELLTCRPDESFDLHTLRVAHAGGPGGAVARTVRLADLDDHLHSRRVFGAPTYAWARQHTLVCHDRLDHTDAA
jgi:hypothetical protein